MATNYPSQVQTFTDPSGTSPLATGPDHAALHTTVNDTLEAIQNTVGTTAGTNVLKDFSAGQFPVRVDSGGTLLQTLTGGTISSPTISVGSDSQGDLYYRSSAGSLTRLGIGTNGQALKTNGTTPSWASITKSSAQGLFTTQVSTNGTAWVNAGSAVITPTGGTVLAMFSGYVVGNATNAIRLRLLRGTTVLTTRSDDYTDVTHPVSFQFLDGTATAGAAGTYNLEYGGNAGGSLVYLEGVIISVIEI